MVLGLVLFTVAIGLLFFASIHMLHLLVFTSTEPQSSYLPQWALSDSVIRPSQQLQLMHPPPIPCFKKAMVWTTYKRFLQYIQTRREFLSRDWHGYPQFHRAKHKIFGYFLTKKNLSLLFLLTIYIVVQNIQTLKPA